MNNKLEKKMPNIRKFKNFINIGDYNFSNNFTYQVFNELNSLRKIMIINIIKPTIYYEYKIKLKELCLFFLQENTSNPINIFEGMIYKINNIKTHISICAIEKIISEEIFEETFINSSLEYVLNRIDEKNIEFFGEDIEHKQFVCFNTKEDNVTRLIDINQKIYSIKYYYSIMNDIINNARKIIVRNTPFLPEKYLTTHIIKNIEGNSDTIIIPIIPTINVGDVIKINNERKVIYSIQTTNHKQILNIGDINGSI